MANTKPAQYHVIVREPSAKAADNEGENFNLFTAKKDRESIFDFISDFAVVACDLQLILTLGNHAMILQLIKNHVMILQ